MNTNKISNKNPTCHSLTNGLAHTCHSLTSDSEEIRNFNQMPYLAHAQGMTGECGRSMVEMLGVLAVIGVLSVGGIAGYKVAMTKHKANELLNEASKRSVVVAAQMLQGRTLSMGEFGNANISGLGVGFNSEIVQDGNLFTIKTNGNIDKLICKEVYKLIGDKSIVRLLQSGSVDVTSVDKCSTAPLAFTYNSELTNIGAGFNGHFDPDDNTKCAEGYYPVGKCNLQCETNQKVNTAGTGCECEIGYEQNGNECAKIQLCNVLNCPSGTECQDNECVCSEHRYLTTIGSCETVLPGCTYNEDCESDEFCYIGYDDSEEAGEPSSGKCEKIKDYPLDTIEIKGRNFKKSEDYMTYWAGVNLCYRHGLLPTTVNDFGLSDEDYSGCSANFYGWCGENINWDEYPIDHTLWVGPCSSGWNDAYEMSGGQAWTVYSTTRCSIVCKNKSS